MTNEEILQAADNARLLEDALRYAQRGWKIFPLAPRSKLPLIGKRFGGRGVLDATCDEAQIRRWWVCQPFANIGIATGAGLIVLDIDLRHGGDETLAALEKTHGTLPKTPLAFTGGGGWHYFFRVEHAIKNSAGKLGTGIDIRGDGGYVVAAGSTHENGRPYAWSLGDHPDETPLAPAPGDRQPLAALAADTADVEVGGRVAAAGRRGVRGRAHGQPLHGSSAGRRRLSVIS